MAKTSAITIRIDPEIKKESEEVLNSLGMTLSQAFDILCRQIIIHDGLPFTVKKPASVSDNNSIKHSRNVRILKNVNKTAKTVAAKDAKGGEKETPREKGKSDTVNITALYPDIDKMLDELLEK
jgi:DNA-damage-inducible protein J